MLPYAALQLTLLFLVYWWQHDNKVVRNNKTFCKTGDKNLCFIKIVAIFLNFSFSIYISLDEGQPVPLLSIKLYRKLSLLYSKDTYHNSKRHSDE